MTEFSHSLAPYKSLSYPAVISRRIMQVIGVRFIARCVNTLKNYLIAPFKWSQSVLMHWQLFKLLPQRQVIP
jgi:hypothetical protein